jgi:hypothetical protein
MTPTIMRSASDIERRGYHGWDDGPRAGVGFRAPGVSVVVGDRW